MKQRDGLREVLVNDEAWRNEILVNEDRVGGEDERER